MDFLGYPVAAASRRTVLALGAGALAGAAIPMRAAIPLRSAVRNRLAVTTVSFRDRIPFHGRATATSTLSLEDAPAFIRKTFGLSQVEYWSLQFGAESDAYCAQLGARTRAAGCTVCNIQLDGPYDLSHPDPAKRAEGEAYALAWVRRAKIVGAPSIRINTDRAASGDRFDPQRLVPIYRRIADYGAQLGVRILIENHIGASRDIPRLAVLARAIDHPNVFTLADWGNTPEPDPAARLSDLALLYPRLALVSAKGLHFDAEGRHVEYPIAPLVAACEASGYRGLYSIEIFTQTDPPESVAAVHAMIAALSQGLAESRRNLHE